MNCALGEITLCLRDHVPMCCASELAMRTWKKSSSDRFLPVGCVKVFLLLPRVLFCAPKPPKNPENDTEVSGQATVGNPDRA